MFVCNIVDEYISQNKTIDVPSELNKVILDIKHVEEMILKSEIGIQWRKSLITPQNISLKNESQAILLKEKGNSFFQKNQYIHAINCYTQALMFLSSQDENQQKESSIVYCNRSLSQYRLGNINIAMEDIEISLKLNNMNAKAHFRKAEYLIKLDDITEAKKSLQIANEMANLTNNKNLIKEIEKTNLQLSSNIFKEKKVLFSEKKELENEKEKEKDLDINLKSMNVNINNDNIKGRYLITKSSLKTGSIIINESPICFVRPTISSSSINKQQQQQQQQQEQINRCGLCLKKENETNSSYIACNFCSCIVYCSLKCLNLHWKRGHYFECGLETNELILNARLCIHMLCFEFTSFFNDINLNDFNISQQLFINWIIKNSENWCLIDGTKIKYENNENNETLKEIDFLKNLECKLNGLTKYDYILILVNICGVIFILLEKMKISLTDQTILIDCIRRACLVNLLKARLNSFTIKSLERFENGVTSVEGHEEVVWGTAIYSTISMLNHNCIPNCLVRFEGTCCKVYCIKPIDQDDILSISYGPLKGKFNTKIRQKYTIENYGFCCSCESCISISGDECVLCPTNSCKGLIPLSNNEFKCTKCNKKAETSFITFVKDYQTSFTKKENQIINLLENNQINESLQIANQQLKSAELLFNSPHILISRSHDLIARIYTTQNNFHFALKHAKANSSIVEKLIGSNSIELFYENVKVCQILIHLEKFVEAESLVKKTYSLGKIHLYENDIDMKELNDMKDFLKKMCLK